MNNQSCFEEKIYSLAFSLVEDIGPAKFDVILKIFSNAKNAWLAEDSVWRSKINASWVEKFLLRRKTFDPEKKWFELDQAGIGFISKNCPEYPSELNEISHSPIGLFFKGNLELLQKKKLAIVGSRLPSEYGKIACKKLSGELARKGLVIVSGMAGGTDQIAHLEAISSGGETIAVLGEGITNREKNSFSKKIIGEIISKNGLILSEYPPEFRATKFTFPARNRIVSGLSLGVLVIEAGEKSGTLITAKWALEQNREIFAIPGSIFSEKSLGTNQLIKEGAKLVRNAQEVLEEFGFSGQTSQNQNLPEFQNQEEKEVFKLLSLEPINIDQIAKKTNLPASKISAHLSIFELSGFVKNIGGGRFIRL